MTNKLTYLASGPAAFAVFDKNGGEPFTTEARGRPGRTALSGSAAARGVWGLGLRRGGGFRPPGPARRETAER